MKRKRKATRKALPSAGERIIKSAKQAVAFAQKNEPPDWDSQLWNVDWSACSEAIKHPLPRGKEGCMPWVFQGSNTPLRFLFENLQDGQTIDEFVEMFPPVTRAQVEAVLRFATAFARGIGSHVCRVFLEDRE
jgi:hypothetical protein